MTYVVCVIDMVRHELTVVNAGHMPPLSAAGGWPSRACGRGDLRRAFGREHGLCLRRADHSARPGDCLVLFTDGFSDAMNPNNEWYGVDRLEVQMLESVADVRELGRRILDDVKRFVGKHRRTMTCACSALVATGSPHKNVPAWPARRRQ